METWNYLRKLVTPRSIENHLCILHTPYHLLSGKLFINFHVPQIGPVIDCEEQKYFIYWLNSKSSSEAVSKS